MATPSLLDHFSALDDPRQAWKVVYPLQEILLLVLCGVMAGADDFAEIERWGNRKLLFLRRILPFARGVPSHDTLNDVINALPAAAFSQCFTHWVARLRETAPDIVAIDGKTSRRARAKGGDPLHLVSAWAARQRLVLGQEAVDVKENEIVAIPRLLERLELTGALVTIDAMGCQREIAAAIAAKGADYLLALKANQKSLHEEVALYFADATGLDTHQSVDADHGRIETRRATVSHDVGWFAGDRAAPGEPRFPGLATVAMVEAEVEEGDRNTRSRRFYISSATLSAAQALSAVRAHWGVENRLHWVMDVVYHDDLMRLRTDNGPANMAVVRHAALNLTKAVPDKASLKIRRKTLAWDDEYLLRAITQTHQ
jgi:predicted transposase YbfD/YdcC